MQKQETRGTGSPPEIEKARRDFFERFRNGREPEPSEETSPQTFSGKELSHQNGVKVFEGPTPDSRIVELADRYEVFSGFSRDWRPQGMPDAIKQPYGLQLKSPDIPFGTARFLVFPDRIDTPAGKTEFDFKINAARKLNASIESEMSKMKEYYSKVAPADAPASFAYGRPSSNKKALAYINETVLERGEHVTLISSKSSDTMTRYRFIENHRFLKGSQEFSPENRSRILEERLPVGVKLHFEFEGAKIKVSPYVANEKTLSTPTAQELYAKRLEAAVTAVDTNASSLDIKVAAAKAGTAYCTVLNEQKQLPNNGGTVTLPTDIATRPSLTEGFKIGFNDLYSSLKPANKQALTYETEDVQQQKIEHTQRNAKSKKAELSL